MTKMCNSTWKRKQALYTIVKQQKGGSGKEKKSKRYGCSIAVQEGVLYCFGFLYSLEFIYINYEEW